MSVQTGSEHAPAFLAVIGLLAASLATGACGEPGFTFTAKSEEQTVPGTPGPAGPTPPLDFPDIGFDINFDRQLEKRNVGPAEAVYLEGMDLKVTETESPKGDTDNFDFLNSIRMSAATRDDDGPESRQIGQLDPVPEEQQRVSLETDDSVNLKPYIEGGMKLEVTANGRPPEDATSVRAIARFRVKIL